MVHGMFVCGSSRRYTTFVILSLYCAWPYFTIRSFGVHCWYSHVIIILGSPSVTLVVKLYD